MVDERDNAKISKACWARISRAAWDLRRFRPPERITRPVEQVSGQRARTLLGGSCPMARLFVPLGVTLTLLAGAVPQISAQVSDTGNYLAIHWQPSLRLADKLARHVDFDGFNDPKLTLVEVLESLTQRHDFTIDVDERDFLEAGCPDVLRERIAVKPIPGMPDVPLSAVLRAILARLPS